MVYKTSKGGQRVGFVRGGRGFGGGNQSFDNNVNTVNYDQMHTVMFPWKHLTALTDAFDLKLLHYLSDVTLF